MVNIGCGCAEEECGWNDRGVAEEAGEGRAGSRRRNKLGGQILSCPTLSLVPVTMYCSPYCPNAGTKWTGCYTA